MSGTLQNKLSNLELPPPPGNWERIASRLDREWVAAEQSVAQKLEGSTLAPPEDAWNNIAAAIDPPVSVEEHPAKVIPIMRNKWLAAAAVIGGISLAIWVFRLNQQSGQVPPALSNPSASRTTPAQKLPEESVTIDAAGPIASMISNIPQQVSVGQFYSSVKKQYDRSSTPIEYDGYQAAQSESEPDQEASPGRFIPKEETAVITGVKAPLIRDSRGRVIMDVNLLKKGSDEYIYVTGPNGEQTRVSARLLNVLIYMNNEDGSQGDYLDFIYNRSETWKKKFDGWRNKLLEQSSFVPSGNTFFDILELRELLKEN